MIQHAVLRRLIWKDVQAIRPLVITIFVAIVALNVLLFLLYTLDKMSEMTFVALCTGGWIALPNLIAFGAPAMLVGGEEESGTLAWLRTLPISWRHIAFSKFLVALTAVAAGLLLAGVFLLIQSFGWSEASRAGVIDAGKMTAVTYHTVLLLILGLVTSYAVRSPLASLLALVPLFTVIAIAAGELTDFAQFRPFALASALAVLIGGWVVQHELARRRLTCPIRTRSWSPASMPTFHYRPAVGLAPVRPSVIASLLWQQTRQVAAASAAIVVICGFLMAVPIAILNSMEQPRAALVVFAGGLAPMFFTLGACWLGALAFYGDSVHRRCTFFADRGVSATLVWGTRLLPPVVALLLLLLLIIGIGSAVDGGRPIFVAGSLSNTLAFCCVLFAFGQLVSLWTDRPILAFLAAPAYAFVSLVPVFSLMDFAGLISSNLAVIILIVPVLLLASWRLTQQWLDGRVGAGFSAQVLAYTAIAVVVPFVFMLLISGHAMRFV